MILMHALFSLSLWERVSVRDLKSMRQVAKPLTFGPLPRGEGAKAFSRVWIMCLCVWLLGHASLPSIQAQTDDRPPAAGPTTPPAPCPSASPDDKERVLLQAETLEYSQQAKRMVATGNVRVIYGDKR